MPDPRGPAATEVAATPAITNAGVDGSPFGLGPQGEAPEPPLPAATRTVVSDVMAILSEFGFED